MSCPYPLRSAPASETFRQARRLRRPKPVSSKCTAWAGEDSLPGSNVPNYPSNEKSATSADKVLQFAAIIGIYPIGYVVHYDWTRPYEER